MKTLPTLLILALVVLGCSEYDYETCVKDELQKIKSFPEDIYAMNSLQSEIWDYCDRYESFYEINKDK
tara:strand:+ start:471 stop:674 length:204 start_codon:yes stop_codon:yes gene_type:complete